MKTRLEDLAILERMYQEAGKGEHFAKNIKPHINSQEDLEDLVKTSFGDTKNVRAEFDGVLAQNEFVDQFYNIYRQRVLTNLKGKVEYIDMFLKQAPFSGSEGKISQDIKEGRDFQFDFSGELWNPEKRPAYLQVISTSIRRQYTDQISIQVIGRAASKEGGLNKYINDRIGLLNEDFVAEIRQVILALIDTITGKTITISVPTELQGPLQKEQRARYILEEITKELKYMKDNSTEYSDNGFTTRTPMGELVGIWDRGAAAEMSVQALGMLRNKEAMNGMEVGKMTDVPTDAMETPFYVKFFTPEKIHYSNSINVSGVDVININQKAVYSKTVWTEADIVDTEPALTVIVENVATPAAQLTKTTTVKDRGDYKKKLEAIKTRREKLATTIKSIYAKKKIKVGNVETTAAQINVAPMAELKPEDGSESTPSETPFTPFGE